MNPRTIYKTQQPWPDPGRTATHPACHLCTWVWVGGVFRIKYVNVACRPHGVLLRER